MGIGDKAGWLDGSETEEVAAERHGNGSRDVGIVADDLEALADAVGGLLESLVDGAATPVFGEGAASRFGIAEAAAALGVGRCRARPLAAEAGMPLGCRGATRLSLRAMNALRDALGQRRGRGESSPARVAVQAFKGGVGKSTLAVQPWIERTGVGPVAMRGDRGSPAYPTRVMGVGSCAGCRRCPVRSFRDTAREE